MSCPLKKFKKYIYIFFLEKRPALLLTGFLPPQTGVN